MVVYLDQNKWIELARMLHGKDASNRAKKILRDFDVATREGRVAVPLSSVHYIETSRISNVARKVRLGEAMWLFSRGTTLAGVPTTDLHRVAGLSVREAASVLGVPPSRVYSERLRLFGNGSGRTPQITEETATEIPKPQPFEKQ
jgi:hypothetical protein